MNFVRHAASPERRWRACATHSAASPLVPNRVPHAAHSSSADLSLAGEAVGASGAEALAARMTQRRSKRLPAQKEKSCVMDRLLRIG